TLALIASVILASMTGRWWFDSRRLRALLAGMGILTLAVAYLGRRSVMAFSPTLDAMYIGSVGLLGIMLVGGLRLSKGSVTKNGGAE
ncbi:MAG: cytochrome oxidase assembly protein, partial [Halobacteriales archaeon]